MGIIITKYEDEANNNIVFDSSKFDFRYETDAEDGFPGDSQEDLGIILDEVGTTYTVIKQTTTENGLGNITDVTESTFDVLAYLQHQTLKDRQLFDMGVTSPGNIKGFFKHEYVDGGTNQVEEGNILTDEEGKTWRVVKILGERHISNSEIIRVAELQNIELGGTL